MIKISNGTLTISLHTPDSAEGYYRGTRFDWAGVFESIEHNGCNYCEPWFESYSPVMHDAVCGPAEEFGPIGLQEVQTGEPFLKVGVGILKKMEGAYDRFKLHEILDEGTRSLEVSDNSATFTHMIGSPTGYGYEYKKEVAINGPTSFVIKHKLTNTGSKILQSDVYNHNFFTMGLLETGPSRQLDFPFRPEGDWRAVYSEVGFTESGIRFSRNLQKGESVFTGNLHEAGKELNGSPNSFVLSESKSPVWDFDDKGAAEGSKICNRSVSAVCNRPMTKAVFWSNHRIACYEPYIDFCIVPGETFTFDIQYTLA